VFVTISTALCKGSSVANASSYIAWHGMQRYCFTMLGWVEISMRHSGCCDSVDIVGGDFVRLYKHPRQAHNLRCHLQDKASSHSTAAERVVS
jgi:hypothetical protein